MGNIIFEDNDTLQQTATKTVLIFAGSSELKKQMQKLSINYTKVQRRFNTVFVLRHKDFEGGKVEIKL